MKETAIDWLFEQMLKQGFFVGNKPLSYTTIDHIQQQAKEIMKEPSKLLQSVIMDLKIREERGLATYGTTMDRKDLSKQEWLQHAYEEALDLALYLKKLMEDYDKLRIKEEGQ
jgi:hypothetical protein